jgi:CheY-like chemotaxis protein
VSQASSVSNKQSPVILVAAESALADSPLSKLLGQAGFRVVTCVKASEAARLMATDKFDCCLIDCLLKAGTADHVVLTARQGSGSVNYRTPIILLSRNFEPELLKRLSPHLALTLKKPVDPMTLVEKIQDLCAKRAQSVTASRVA